MPASAQPLPQPSFLTALRSSAAGSGLQQYLFFAAEGLDTSWLRSSDACRGFRPRSAPSVVASSGGGALSGAASSPSDLAVLSSCRQQQALQAAQAGSVHYAVTVSDVRGVGLPYDCLPGYAWASTAEA